ncbi:MAG: peptide chain release factor N(5)-glutamine methyltransferase [Myxococcota bacterium]|jgi:release factor glutamine methyltransferase|nr:peptide chain release factor N(5)-glutamine methyltransferase [Myxococcota bacterium]
MGTWHIADVLSFATEDFGKRGFTSPRLEAEVLLTFALACSRLQLYTSFDRPLEESELRTYRELIARRRGGEPTAYITGHKEFWSLDLLVDERVLIPRPDTETLVAAALEHWSTGSALDLCTGSGCVALALASERKNATVDAVDISADACAVAEENASRLGCQERVHVWCGDLWDALPPKRRYGLITANPPYVREDEYSALSQEVRREPRLALCAGADGLDVVRRILQSSGDWLEPGGVLALEVGIDQAELVAQQLGPELLGQDGKTVADLTGRPRVVIFHLSSFI